MHEFFYWFGLGAAWSLIFVFTYKIIRFFVSLEHRQDTLNDNLESLKLRVGRLESKNRSNG